MEQFKEAFLWFSVIVIGILFVVNLVLIVLYFVYPMEKEEDLSRYNYRHFFDD